MVTCTRSFYFPDTACPHNTRIPEWPLSCVVLEVFLNFLLSPSLPFPVYRFFHICCFFSCSSATFFQFSHSRSSVAHCRSRRECHQYVRLRSRSGVLLELFPEQCWRGNKRQTENLPSHTFRLIPFTSSFEMCFGHVSVVEIASFFFSFVHLWHKNIQQVDQSLV